MENSPARPQNMIDTTDALEAVSACQSMKNFLFVLILIGLILCQIIFWMDHFGFVNKKECAACDGGIEAVSPVPCKTVCPAGAVEGQCLQKTKPQAKAPNSGPVFLAATTDQVQKTEQAAAEADPSKTIKQALDEIVKSANQAPPAAQDAEVILEKPEDYIPADIVEEVKPAEAAEPEAPSEPAEAAEKIPVTKDLFGVSCQFAKGLVMICNFIVLAAVILYSLSLLMCLKISLAGRLGGINHITRAFFISLFLLVALIPWQTLLSGVLIGTVWMPNELLCCSLVKADSSVFCKVMLYLRFCGLFLIAIWLLLWTQIRSAKWARATLRRLGVAR